MYIKNEISLVYCFLIIEWLLRLEHKNAPPPQRSSSDRFDSGAKTSSTEILSREALLQILREKRKRAKIGKENTPKKHG